MALQRKETCLDVQQLLFIHSRQQPLDVLSLKQHPVENTTSHPSYYLLDVLPQREQFTESQCIALFNTCSFLRLEYHSRMTNLSRLPFHRVRRRLGAITVLLCRPQSSRQLKSTSSLADSEIRHCWVRRIGQLPFAAA